MTTITSLFAVGLLVDPALDYPLAKIAANVAAVEEQKRRLIELYASDQLAGAEYVAQNLALDEELDRRAEGAILQSKDRHFLRRNTEVDRQHLY
jgi:AAA+ superfamily predicted ATPase